MQERLLVLLLLLKAEIRALNAANLNWSRNR